MRPENQGTQHTKAREMSYAASPEEADLKTHNRSAESEQEGSELGAGERAQKHQSIKPMGRIELALIKGRIEGSGHGGIERWVRQHC